MAAANPLQLHGELCSSHIRQATSYPLLTRYPLPCRLGMQPSAFTSMLQPGHAIPERYAAHSIPPKLSFSLTLLLLLTHKLSCCCRTPLLQPISPHTS